MERSSLERQVTLEQARVLARQLPIVVGTSLLTSVLVVLALRERVPDAPLVPWLGAAVAVAALRVLYLLRWRRQTLERDGALERRLREMTALSGLSGTLWGVFGLLVVSVSDPVASLVAVMVLTGMVASAAASLSHFRGVYVAFVLPTLAPAALKFLTFDETLYVWVGALIGLYLVVSIAFSRGIRVALRRSIELGLANRELVEELRARNRHVERARDEAERANLAKSRFLAAASHDLRQPMHSLRLFTAALAAQTSATARAETVSRIDAAVRALEELFTALLDISKLDAGTWPVEREHVRLARVLERVERGVEALAREKGLALHVSSGEAVVHTDPVLLERLLGNLVGNAVRHTEAGSVTLRTETRGPNVRIIVADTGPGIDPEHHESVFEEFVQLGNPERDRSRGLGLGLSIVRRIARLLGLPLALESSPGRGTVFSVDVERGERGRMPVVASSSPATPHLAGLFVLVVDDEEAVRRAMVALLETWGCVVLAADSAEAALVALVERESAPDVVVADFRLREERTGAEAVAAVRRHCGVDMPGILVTGDIAPGRLRAVEASGLPVLHKPCDPDRLREYLGRVRDDPRR